MASNHPTLPRAAVEELSDYFGATDSILGLASSFGVLVDAAMGGWGGSRDQESRITDRRFRFGHGETAVTRAIVMRRALLGLPAERVTVLYAAHGTTDWGRVIDDAFGRGMGAKANRALPGLVGVALLTEAVRAGFAAVKAREPALADLVYENGPGEWETDARLRARTMAVVEPREREGLEGLTGAALTKAAKRAGVHRVQCVHPRNVYRPLAEPSPVRGLYWKSKAKPWETEGGYLVSACISKDKGALKRISDQAAAMLHEAHAAYAAARGIALVTEEEATAPPRKRPPSGATRRPRFDPFAEVA